MENKKLSVTDILIGVLILTNIGIFGYFGLRLLFSHPTAKLVNVPLQQNVVSPPKKEEKKEAVNEPQKPPAPEETVKPETPPSVGLSWEIKKAKILKEFDAVWGELENKMVNQLKGLSPEEVNSKLTPLVVDEVIKRLGVSKEEVFRAGQESGAQE